MDRDERILESLTDLHKDLSALTKAVYEQAAASATARANREADKSRIDDHARILDELSRRINLLEQESARVRLLVAIIGIVGGAIGAAIAQIILKVISGGL